MTALGVWAIGLSLVGATAAAGVAGAADSGAVYSASAEVRVQGSESLQRLRLPLALLQATRRPGWADLRLLDASGAALPWAWAGAPGTPQPPAARRQPLVPLPWPAAAQGQPATQVKIEWRADGSALRVEAQGVAPVAPSTAAPAATEPRAWLLDLQALGSARPAALWLDWAPQPHAGLVLSLRAEASADAQQWVPVGQAVLVELAAPGPAASLPLPSSAPATPTRQVLQQRVELAGLQAGQRYLRLVADAPWPLRSAAAEFELPAPADEQALDRLTLPVPTDGVLDLGTALPLRQLRFTLATDAGVLPLALERQAPDGRTGSGAGARPWWPVASHTAWRLQQGGTWMESPPLALDGSAARHWRLRSAGPTPGVLPSQVHLAWTAPQLVFVASGRTPYRLEVGRADAPDAALPLPALMPGYRGGDEHRLPQAALGKLQMRASTGHGWRDTTPAERRRWLLWAALAAAVVVLAGLAWRLLRDMREGRSDPADSPKP